MESLAKSADYFIWGIDDSPYGPVPLPVLLDWINDERVLPETWIFTRVVGSWQKASDMPELMGHFKNQSEVLSKESSPVNFRPGMLRRIKILADLKDAQLAHLADFLEFREFPQHTMVVRQGEAGDAMFLVMDGELRARTMVTGREAILATFCIGDFFGEMALFDQGPRSADVVANKDSATLRLSATSFQRLTQQAPNLATPFLMAVSRTLSSRIRTDNKRLTVLTQQFSASNGVR
jgi:CRP/FNR family transcriptional regulator, cyclic AMP receptor protein